MSMREIITEILQVAVHAPSGHNSQPWRFLVRGNSVFLQNIPEKDEILFNYKQRGSLVAHGALIENIFIIASKKGYEANVTLFPYTSDPYIVAQVNLKKSTFPYPYVHLSSFIPTRATNRKPYAVTPLQEKDKIVLEKFSESLKGTRTTFIFTQTRENIGQLARSFSIGDRLIFENRHIHKALFDNVNWTLQEELNKREGLYIRTKELSFFQRIVFTYLLSNWNVVGKLDKIKLSSKIAAKRAKLYEQCSAIGLVVAPTAAPRDFVESGRILQRLWLTVTSLGLCFQPLSVGLLYLGQRVEQENPPELTHFQIAFIKQAYQDIKKVFLLTEKFPMFSFRIGYSSLPTAHSVKKAPEIIYQDELR